MIGVFDSGLGGLNVLKYFLRDLPGYDYIYLGDNARAPYGDKPQESIFQYTKEAVDFLFSQNCRLIILACNTASSQALRKIQQEYLPDKYPGKRVLGVVRPLIEEVVKNKPKKIGIMGTKATIESNVYQIEINKLSPAMQVFQASAPLLAPLIEAGWSEKSDTDGVLRNYLKPFEQAQVDDLILACTHYLELGNEVRSIMGEDCRVYSPGDIIADSLKKYLSRHPELEITISARPVSRFFTTGDIGRFKELGGKILGREIRVSLKA